MKNYFDFDRTKKRVTENWIAVFSYTFLYNKYKMLVAHLKSDVFPSTAIQNTEFRFIFDYE